MRALPVARLLVVSSLVSTLVLTGCAKKESSTTSGTAGTAGAPTVKVGLVFDVGGRGDKSFNDAAYAGLERAHKELNLPVESTEYIEPGEGGDRESALRQLAAGPYDLIFGVGFLFSDDILSVAKDYPNKHFACIDMNVPAEGLPPNVVALKFKEEEGSYLVGALSGYMTKTGRVGFVGGMQIPLIKKFEAGYVAGVKKANPSATVDIKYAGVDGNAFKNPTKGKELALAIYGAGADIIYHASGSTGLGVFEAAEEKKKLAIGVDSDQYDPTRPGIILTSMVKRVDVAVFNTIQDEIAGRFPGGQVHVFDLEEKGVDYVDDANNQALIPDDVRQKVEALRQEIIAGTITPPSE
jgi:basic membrane protein A